MNQSVATSSAINGYRQWSPTPTSAAEQTVALSVAGNTPTVIQTFATNSGVPNETLLQAGNWGFTVHLSIDANDDLSFYAEVYKYSIGGVSTLLGATNTQTQTIASNTVTQYYTDVFIPSQALVATDRLYCKIFVEHVGGSNKTITFYTEGSTYYSYAQTTFNPPSGTSEGGLNVVCAYE